MAQSVRRPENLGGMDNKATNRTGYFGNVRTRLNANLPAGVSQTPQSTKGDQDMQDQNQPTVGRPLSHTPHIRNPRLRQYYLQETSEDVNAAVKGEKTGKLREQMGKLSADETGSIKPGELWAPHWFLPEAKIWPSGIAKALHPSVLPSLAVPVDTVFTVSSHFDNAVAPSADKSRMDEEQVVVPEGKNISLPELDSEVKVKPPPGLETEPGSSGPLSVQPQSPSPEAEYDKLLDVEAVPMPDGQLCLLALPPECCEGEGPEVTPYLKLFCRYITDRKGVVSGILLVTPNKIFFDPCKTHSLVKEHGCEEYLLSCSMDNLTSVSFFSDLTHVHFNPSQQRRRGKKILQKFKATKTRVSNFLPLSAETVTTLDSGARAHLCTSPALSQTEEISVDEEAEGRDMAEAERELEAAGALGVSVLSSAATFCCGGQEAGSKVKTELLHHSEPTEKLSVKTAVPQRSPASSPGGLMFVRLRVQLKKGVAGLHQGSAKTKSLPKKDTWLALSQESSDELYAYLKRCRPHLCIFGGEEQGAADRDEEEFVLIDDQEEEEEGELFLRHRGTGDDWEMVLMEGSGNKLTLTDRVPEGFGHIAEHSNILEASHIQELGKELPPTTVFHTWHLAYSTSSHGSSLKSLYRRLSGTDAPVLVVIKDAREEVFGAFLSHPLRPSDKFYGTGETFLFMLHPRFKCFRWTGENSFFIKGDLDSFAIGGGSGHFGLWLDENLYLGRSSPCYTFNNCCLSETPDFRVLELEVWTFS
ncbi:nuclear receptor coactivator 7 [Thalassophryne amazonica]|uniref:nuclear receptor coactivator 7 n=1 Tax=Thalassophryne amazonica TaxID=390379 RepID=UPI001472320F|nr:nuclear receptor coactivator 7 [Thalassophryne amazonica]XP_034015572.1 nuclear receptor coactivator 7 [Thalassophryne amazonica]